MNILFSKINPSTFFFILIIPFIIFTSCKKEEEDLTAEVVNVYHGRFHSLSIATLDLNVTVTKVDNQTVHITPDTGGAVAFDVKLLLNNIGDYISSTGQVVVFKKMDDGRMTLTYERNWDKFGGIEK